jgi:hypothetical protein
VRSRHIPRICRTCDAPMASGVAACWRCGVRWAEESQPSTTLRLVAGHAAGEQARSDVERWTNEGGAFRSDARVPRRAAARS